MSEQFIPKSRRCTSSNPWRGYLGCDKERHHPGPCEGFGYKWWRGRGHARPVRVSAPANAL